MNNIIFGQYYAANSWVHRLDPRTKIISLIGLIVALFLIDNLAIMLSFVGILFILILMTKVPVKLFFKSMKAMKWILILTFIFQAFFHYEGELIKSYNLNLTYMSLGIIIVFLISWIFLSKYIKKFKTIIFIGIVILTFIMQYFINITPIIKNYEVKFFDESLMNATFVIVRLMGFLFISSLLTLTTKPSEINNALEALLKPLKKFKIDTSTITMSIAIALRFVPNLVIEAQRVLKAQTSRGADFKEGNLYQKASQVVSLIIPLFVIAYKKSIDLGYAMDARGYNPKALRSSIYELKYYKKDYFIMILLLVTNLGLLIIRFI